MAADLPKLARVGDSVECEVRHPYPRTIRMTLETPEAAAHANDLLMDPKSGWRLTNRPITNLAEFCAEGARLGVTAASLAEALSKRPEFADCLPTAGVNPSDGGSDEA